MKSTDDLLIEQLRNILLTEDRASVRRLEKLLDDPDLLASKVSPILEQRLEFFKKNFPKEFRVVVDRLIEERLQNSQEKLIEIIYPMLGSMVKKYIEQQFQLLKESIEERMSAVGRRLNFWQRLKNRLAGVSAAEVVLAAAAEAPSVEEIYLIQRHSGALLAHAAKNENFDREAVAGMLTAIKAFVEDAFRTGNEELDLIAYDRHKILVQNYRAYYIAALVRGSLSTRERVRLAERLHDVILTEFVHLQNFPEEQTTFERISGLLEEKFLREKSGAV